MQLRAYSGISAFSEDQVSVLTTTNENISHLLKGRIQDEHVYHSDSMGDLTIPATYRSDRQSLVRLNCDAGNYAGVAACACPYFRHIAAISGKLRISSVWLENDVNPVPIRTARAYRNPSSP